MPHGARVLALSLLRCAQLSAAWPASTAASKRGRSNGPAFSERLSGRLHRRDRLGKNREMEPCDQQLMVLCSAVDRRDDARCETADHDLFECVPQHVRTPGGSPEIAWINQPSANVDVEHRPVDVLREPAQHIMMAPGKLRGRLSEPVVVRGMQSDVAGNISGPMLTLERGGLDRLPENGNGPPSLR